MQVDFLFPVLPPTLDSIGDHTARLASALATYADVRALKAQVDAEKIPDIEVQRTFQLPPRRGVMELSTRATFEKLDLGHVQKGKPTASHKF